MVDVMVKVLSKLKGDSMNSNGYQTSTSTGEYK